MNRIGHVDFFMPLIAEHPHNFENKLQVFVE
jgi:hypothetical protein